MAILRGISEEDIAQALLSLPASHWPQDERDLLLLFNQVIDRRFAALSCNGSGARPPGTKELSDHSVRGRR